MAERCGNRFGSLPTCVRKDASSSLVDVADGNIMGSLEANVKPVQSPKGPKYDDRHLGSSSQCNDALPIDISNYPDPFRSLGWDRLLPFDLDNSDGLPLYYTYLEKFYHLHKNPVDDSIADAAIKCLRKENNLRLYWLAFKVDVIPSDARLSNDICDCMLELFQNGDKSEGRPFVIEAAACIVKEARLIMKFLRQGRKVPYSQYNLSRNIQRLALNVAMFQGKWSPETAALLLGITKEAELLLENMSGHYLDAIDTSTEIRKFRKFALQFLGYIFDEIENDEMTSDVEPTCGLTREFEKNELKMPDNMDKQPRKANNGSDLSE